MNLYALHTKPETLFNFNKRLTFPKFAYDYVYEGGKATPEIEKAIAKDADYAYNYANDILKGRFPQGEEVIAKHGYYSFVYARNVLKSRFPAGEAAIATHSDRWAFLYARDVIKSRFPEAEELIKKNAHLWQKYKERFNL